MFRRKYQLYKALKKEFGKRDLWKMTDNDIIKALEICRNENGICSDCPYSDDYTNCNTRIAKDSIDLINRQKEEIERLTAMLEAAEDYLYPLPFKNAFDDELAKAKSEAIKEFAERLKNAFPEGNRDNKCPAIYIDDYCYIIDECAEEMVGENNAE